MQATLFRNKSKDKSIVKVEVSRLDISNYNPRRTRPNAYIDALAKRIDRNGFEITRAPWVYEENGIYKVFAGWTRCQAARCAGLSEIPVVVHIGFTEEEIVRLADEDNENDEYHREVPIVDVWASYKALADRGWTQERIGRAKGVSQNFVSYRVRLAELPGPVLGIINKENLNERQCRNFLQLSPGDNLTPWLTREAAMLHVMDAVLSQTKNPTAKRFKRKVNKINAAIEIVQEAVSDLPEKWHERLFAELLSYSDDGLSKTSAIRAVDTIKRQIAANKRQAEEEARAQLEEAERERIQAEREERMAKRREKLFKKIVLGDAREANIPDNIKLVCTDPPYGKKFQSNRRVVSAKADKIKGDTPDEALSLLRDVMEKLYDRMTDDSVLLCWSSWEYYAEFRATIADCGFKLKSRPIIWLKSNHSSGDLAGGYAPNTELIIYAVKGNPKFTQGRSRPIQTQKGEEFLESEHPTRKPIDLLRELIQNHTRKGDLVVDPFAGSGATVKAALQVERKFWACELERKWHSDMCNSILPEIERIVKENV